MIFYSFILLVLYNYTASINLPISVQFTNKSYSLKDGCQIKHLIIKAIFEMHTISRDLVVTLNENHQINILFNIIKILK